MSSESQLPYQNPELPVTERVADLLARMTPEEKLAQITGVWREGGKLFDESGQFCAETAERRIPHGIGSVSRQREELDPAATARYANDLQTWLREHTRLGIPAHLHAEALHGDMELGGTQFPQPLALAASWDEDLIGRIFQAAALEVRSRGGHHVLGPNLDLGREPRWGRTEETYGEDPWLAARLGVACVRGLQGPGPGIGEDRVLATGKHFAAHGQPEGGTNGGPVNVTERSLRDMHFVPFEAAIREAGLASIMPAYHEIDGVPCHANTWLLEDVLRGEWGFGGLIVSDYYAVEQMVSRHAIAGEKDDAAQRAFAAGVDVELPDPDCYPAALESIAAGSMDASVARVLRSKFELGLFENPLVNPERAAAVVNSPAHQALACEAALRSVVLLKNDGGILPLDPVTVGRVAVIGPNAADVHLGGYSADPGRGVSVLAGLSERLGEDRVVYAPGCKLTNEGGNWWADDSTLPDPAENSRLINDAAALAQSSDLAILVIGGNEDTHKEGWHETHLGDRDTIDLSEPQQELFDAVHAAGRPVIVVLIHSGPLAISRVVEKATAILDAFYPGQEGGTAVAALICGDANPSGKLAITYPRSTGQIPAAYNHKPTARRGYLFTSKEPLFPFGHGLSYTTFAYSDLTISPETIAPSDTAEVRVTVTNTGTRAGDEIVQLYVRDDVSSVTRPVRELKGFSRIVLTPGESRTVTLPLGPAQLSFTDGNNRRVVEPGTFTIMVGPNSCDGPMARLEVTDPDRADR